MREQILHNICLWVRVAAQLERGEWKFEVVTTFVFLETPKAEMKYSKLRLQ